MKTTLLWLLVCFFYGLSLFLGAILLMTIKRADIEERLTTVERRQQYYASGEFKKAEKPKTPTVSKGVIER